MLPRFLPPMHTGRRMLLTLAGLLTLALHVGAQSPAFADEIAAFEAIDAELAPLPDSVLFTGSSSIRLWKTLAADFPDTRVINRGFGGSQIRHLVHYFDRIVRVYYPRRIIVYSATNDLDAGFSVDGVLEDWQTFCGMVEVALPDTTIALISIAPNPARWEQRDRQQEFNARAAAFCAERDYDFIDVWTPMLGEDGLPSRDIYIEDGLHMNAAGYTMWREIVGKYVD